MKEHLCQRKTDILSQVAEGMSHMIPSSFFWQIKKSELKIQDFILNLLSFSYFMHPNIHFPKKFLLSHPCVNTSQSLTLFLYNV